MPDSESLGIGFVGTGFVTETFHAESLRGIRNAHGAGVMNPTASKAERVADRIREFDGGDPTVHETVPSLVADPAVEAVWIATPNHVRVDTVETVVQAIEDGAVLDGIAIEKPLARTVAEAQRIVELIESVDVAHAYLENQVYMPGVERMKDSLWASATETGRPYLARAAEEHAGPHSAWFWDGERQGGGVLNDMMCHSHKVNRHLLASPGGDDLTPRAVSADISTLKWQRQRYAETLAAEYGVDYKNAPAEDYAQATVYYETPEGELAVAESTNSWCFVGSGLRITMELLGPEYSGQLNTLEGGLNVFVSSDASGDDGYFVEKQQATEGSMPLIPDEVSTYGYLDQNRHVVDAFRRGENAREDIYDGLDVVKLCMASYLAAERGERVRLDDEELTNYIPEPARGAFEPEAVLESGA